jgi:hypothetical protein
MRAVLCDDRLVAEDQANNATNEAKSSSTGRSRLIRQSPLQWTAELAYAVGLVATDGGLAKSGRHVSFVSKDIDQIRNFLRAVGRPNATIRRDDRVFRVYFGDVELHRWLREAGLTPRKSLTMRGLNIPDEFFFALVRGLFDGDGSISHYVHRPVLRAYPGYRYRRLTVRFHSASHEHLQWLGIRLGAALSIRGSILKQEKARVHPMYALQYAKYASIELLTKLYEDPASPRLHRKWLIWEDFRAQPVTTRPYRRRSPPR